MNIWFICSGYSKLHGGIELFIHNVAIRLAKKHKVTIISGKYKDFEMKKDFRELESSGIKFELLPFISRDSLISKIGERGHYIKKWDYEALTLYLNYLKCRKEIMKVKPNIISVHTPLESILFSRYFLKKKFQLCIIIMVGMVHQRFLIGTFLPNMTDQ